MSDYASIIGGDGTQLPIQDAPKEDAVFYSNSSGTDWNIDLGAESDFWSGSAGSGDNSVFGASGEDTINTGTGSDLASGQVGDDSVSTDGGDDVAVGGGGNDTIDVGDGDFNLATGSDGGDLILGGTGSDFLAGGTGSDTISGGDGSDFLFGQSSADEIEGGAGNDRLFGQNGDDSLTGGAGNDSMWGGDQDDVFYFDDGFGNDVINDFSLSNETGNNDVIWLTPDINDTGITSAQDLVDNGLVSGSASETIITLGSDTITIKGVAVDDFTANISDYVKVQ